MNRIHVRNVTRDVVLADAALLADGPLTRMRGLLGRPCPGAREGLVLAPCYEIHTFFMGYAIDVAFVTRDGEVVKVLRELPPWRMTLPCMGAYWTVELAPGGLGETEVGDRLEFLRVE